MNKKNNIKEKNMNINKMICTIFFISTLLSFNILFAQDDSEKIYWMSTIEVAIGDLSDFHSFNMKQLKPLTEKYGYKPVATWQTIVGDIEQVITVSEFENMTAYHKARKSLLGSEGWREIKSKFNKLTKSIRTRFLSAAPYSSIR